MPTEGYVGPMWCWWLIAAGCGLFGQERPVQVVEVNRCAAEPPPADLVPLTVDNVAQLQQVATLCDPADRGTILALDTFGSELVSAGERSGVQIWDLKTAGVRTLTVDEPVHTVQWVPNPGMLLLGTEGGEVFGVDFEGRRRWQAAGLHQGAATAVALRVEEGDVYSAGADGWVHRWSLRDGRELARRDIGGRVADLVLHDDALVVCGDEMTTHALDAATLAPGRAWAKDRDSCWALAERPIADHLAVGTGQIVVWEDNLETRYWHPIEGSVRAMDYEPQGDLLAVGTWGGQLLVFDPAARALVTSRKPSTSRMLAVAFAPDGRFIATAGDGGVVRIWGVRATRR